MAPRPPVVALVFPPLPAYSRALVEGVAEARGTRRRWSLVELPHARTGRPPVPPGRIELDGAIVWADRRDSWIERLVGRGVRVVNCGSDWLGVPGVATVRADRRHAFRAVAEHIAGLGLREAHLLGHLLAQRPGMRRILGEFADTARRAGLRVSTLELGGRDNPDDSPRRLLQPAAERRLSDLLRRLAKPAAVLCENDHIGVLVCRHAARLGLRIPEDLVVTGYGDNLVARFSDPPLTSVSVPGRAVGQAAAQCLARWLEGTPPPAAGITVPGATLAIRESTVGKSGSVALERVRRQIAATSPRAVTVSQLADLAGLSFRTLVRRYTEAYGIEPAEDIRRRRLAAARAMLLDRALPVAAVAAACGFSSQANFYNFFLRHAGASPTAWRKNHNPQALGPA